MDEQDPTNDPIRTTLTTLAQQARQQRLAGDYHHGSESEFPLIGYCFDNAYVCWHVFDDHGFDARLVEGTTERVADDLITEGLDPREFDTTTELAGLVHYWVEVETDEATYTVDIASDTWDRLGECLVARGRPAEYVVLPDSITSGDESLQYHRETGGRCSYCGGVRYETGGCPECVDDCI